jgi:hypothetical protein
MSAVKALITRHPVAAYFALAFAISWGGALLTAIVHGRSGLRELLSRLVTWRVGASCICCASDGPSSDWMAVGLAAMIDRRQLSRQPLRKRAA